MAPPLPPRGRRELRGSTLGELSRMGYELTTAPETVETLRTLMENREELDPITRRKAESCGVTTTAPTVSRWRNT